MADPASIHASAVVFQEAGILIRGASGSGKSSLALALAQAGALRGQFARLVADDRVLLECAHCRLIARPHTAIAGRVERRGQGVGAVAHEDAVVVRLVVDLAPALGTPGAPTRMPPKGADIATLEGVNLPRLEIPAGLGAPDTARIVLEFILRGQI